MGDLTYLGTTSGLPGGTGVDVLWAPCVQGTWWREGLRWPWSASLLGDGTRNCASLPAQASWGIASPSLGLRIFQECPWGWRRLDMDQ